MDLVPFEPALPPAVRALLADGHAGRGPLAAWCRDTTNSATYALVRGVPAVPVEVVGWLVALRMFEDDRAAVSAVMERERITGPAPIALAACASGLRAGLAVPKRFWLGVQTLVGLAGAVPPELRAALPVGIASKRAVDRGIAMKLAQRAGDGIGAHPAQPGEPLRAKSKTELEAVWRARAAAGNPDDLDVLLGTPWPGAWKDALARVQALASFAPDARIGGAMTRVIDRYTSLAAHALRFAAQRLQQRAAAAPRRMPAAPGARVGELAQLWAAFHARPADLPLRAVLADALQAIGDPRGEYIALELARGPATAAARKRAAQLLAAHVDTWTGGIPGVIRDSLRFDRGFLAAVHCRTNGSALAESLSAPAWATVEELHLSTRAGDYSNLEEPLEALLERAPSLRTLVNRWAGTHELFARLGGEHPRVRSIGFERRTGITDAKLDRFPNLALIGTVTEAVAPVLRSLRGRPVDALLLFTREPLATALTALATAPNLCELRVAPEGRTLADHVGWLVRVRRGEPRAQLSWGSQRYAVGSLTETVAALVADGRREIAVALPATGRAAALAEAAAITGATLDLAAAPIDLWRA